MDAANMKDCIEDPAERIRQRADATLTRRLQDPQRLSPGSLVRVLFPVIEKHLAAGLTLEDIAAALRDDGFAIKRTHLVRHLGIIRAENGLPQLQRGVKAAPQPQGAKKEVTGDALPAPAAAPAPLPQPPTPAPAPAPASSASPAIQSASDQPGPAPAPVPFPEIPRGELTHTERAEIAKRWIEAQFGGRHPTQIKPDELTADAQAWLEKLWDQSAPVNQKTGKAHAFKRFTPDGRLTYDEPWFPPEAVRVINDKKENDYVLVHDAEVRALMKKHGLGLHADRQPTLLFMVDEDGKQCSASFGRGDMPCLGRMVREHEWFADRQKSQA